MTNKYLDWIEKEAGILGLGRVIGQTASEVGKSGLKMTGSAAKGVGNWLKDNTRKASGTDFRNYVNSSVFHGTAGPKSLEKFSPNSAGMIRLKSTLANKNSKAYNRGILDKAKDIAKQSRTAKVKLGFTGAGLMYSGKKLVDKVNASKEENQNIYY